MGYTTFRRHRVLNDYSTGTYCNEARGGVLLMVRNSFNPTECKEIKVEMLWVDTNPVKNITWKIGVCYRLEADREAILERICGSIDSVDVQNVILLGDLNFWNIDWVTGDCASSLEKSFLDCLQDNLLVQCVDSPQEGKISSTRSCHHWWPLLSYQVRSAG